MKFKILLFQRRLIHTSYTLRQVLLEHNTPNISFPALKNFLKDDDQYSKIIESVKVDPILSILYEHEKLFFGTGGDESYSMIHNLRLVPEFGYDDSIGLLTEETLKKISNEIKSAPPLVLDFVKANVTAAIPRPDFNGIVCDLVPSVDIKNGEIRRFDQFEPASGVIRVCPNKINCGNLVIKPLPILKTLSHELAHVIDYERLDAKNSNTLENIWNSEIVIQQMLNNSQTPQKQYECIAACFDPDLKNNYKSPYSNAKLINVATLRELLPFYAELLFDILKKSKIYKFFEEKCSLEFRSIFQFLDSKASPEQALLTIATIKAFTKGYQEIISKYLSSENKNIFLIVNKILNSKVQELKLKDFYPSLELPGEH